MNNTLQNTVRWSDDDSYLVINTRNKQGKLHSWEWVINENELNDYTEWDYKDMATSYIFPSSFTTEFYGWFSEVPAVCL